MLCLTTPMTSDAYIVFVILDTLHLMHDTTETLNEIT